jgi:flagellin
MTGTVTVGGVSVVITGDEYTPALAAAKIAAAMQSSPLYDSSTGRKVKYATGSASISVEFPLKEGNVEKLTVSPGATGIGSVVNTIQPYANKSAGTGVFAKVNENVLTGQAMVSGPIATGVVFVNGFASANITTVYNNSQATRDNVVRAINLISDKTGVRAINTGSDEKGISLVAVDGRNIEVRFEPTGSTSSEVLGQRIGMREGVQSATISLESKIQAPVVLSSDAAGDIKRAGLVDGNYSKNQSVLNTRPRDPVQAAVAQLSSVKLQTNATAGDSVTVVVNGTQFVHDVAADATAAQKTPQYIVDSLITNINANSTLGVYATKGREVGEILLAARTPGVAFTMTASSGATISASATDVTENRVADFRSLGMDDLEINGVKIRPTTARDDKFSNTVVSSSDPASSGLALAAAINASSTLTGVKAEANPVVSQGAITSTETPITGKQSLWVNGIEVSVNFVQNESGTDRRAKVAAAINERTGQHGVIASDNGKGVTLETDGRNLSVWFDSSQDELSAADFGLSKGGELKQISKLSVANAAYTYSPAPALTVDASASATGTYTVTFEELSKGQTLTVDGLTLFALDDMTDDEVAAAFATASIGSTPASGTSYSFKGELTTFAVSGTTAPDVTFDSTTNADVLAAPSFGSTVSVMINGVTIRASANQGATAAQTATALATAIEDETSLKNVSAEADDNGNILVSSDVAGSPFDIRSPEVVYSSAQTLKLSTVQENSAGKTDVSAVDMSAAYKTQVLGSVSAPVSAMDIKTLYGTVRLTAAAPNLPALPGTDGLAPDMMNINGQAIQIRSGADGFGGLSNFSQLGFNEGSFGGRASTDMDPPRVGRMAFQVGSSANQVITIDLADFGKNGPITGEITGDVDLQVEQRQVRIHTREGASEVLNLLDSAMDKINATRATMGAVMNRLDHVINNLTNVSMNLSASRSSIEDADYAKASTDLAKTQIMQQAATAVLAQANTSQQSVLKLLGG